MLLKPNRTPLQYPKMKTTLQIRHLNRRTDFPRITEFLRSRHKQTSLPDYWTIGSKMCFYLNLFESSESDHHLWEDQSGDIHAYTEVIPSKRSWNIQIHTDYRDEQHLPLIIDAAEKFIDGHPEAEAKSIQYQTKVYESDALLLSLLQARGYEQGKYDSPYFRRSLEPELPPVTSRGDFTIR